MSNHSLNQRLTSPFVIVIFGATGDLTQRKLLPALFHLYQKKLLPEHFFIVGFSRRSYSTEDFKEFLSDALKKYDTAHSFDERVWQTFSGKLYYQQGEFGEASGYRDLIEKLAEFDGFMKACVPRYFYLATPPDKYSTIIEFLDQTKLAEGCGQGSDKWTKVMVEKPFGRSLEEAKTLDSQLSAAFKEEQIYRIDHYLGKETVQNIIAFRYGNTIFDAVWNRQFIDHVQITIAETLGVETRGNFYEGVGALRDMTQSHLLELMAAVAMKPTADSGEAIRSARAKIIGSIHPIESEDVEERVVRGQYGENVILERIPPKAGEAIGSPMRFYRPSASRMTNNIKAYREEPNVDPTSNTETFVAIKLTLDDPRWQGVPFYLRTGKRLARKATEISIIFKEPRFNLFKLHVSSRVLPRVFPQKAPQGNPFLGVPQRMSPARNGELTRGSNILTFRLEPNEGIEMAMMAKKVGLTTEFEQVPLSFNFRRDVEMPDAYERILLDAMRGDQTLFTRTDEVKSAWELISKIAEGWERFQPDFPNYAAGSWGPDEAEELIERDGRKWLLR